MVPAPARVSLLDRSHLVAGRRHPPKPGATAAAQSQAATGLLAIIVLLVVMNWFFHKVYWTGWISMHRRRKQLDQGRVAAATLAGARAGVLGFSSVYREGFEVVLFLQNLA